MTAAGHPERVVAIADLGERLSALRLADAVALRAMRASVQQRGQLSLVRAFERDGAVEIFDGFKRLRAARLMGFAIFAPSSRRSTSSTRPCRCASCTPAGG